MSEHSEQPDAPAAPFDGITARLRAFRAAAGEPSYAELVRRVMRQRMDAGMTEWDARVGRTTVYDAFRPGRYGLDPDLVADLVRALGGSPEEAGEWAERCRQVARDAARAGVAARRPPSEPTSSLERAVDSDPEAPGVQPRPGLAPGVTVAFLVGCLALNLGGRVLVSSTHMALFLDMGGTAVAAIIVGPWWGALVGVLTSVAGMAVSGWISVPFAPVEVVGALMWGYGVRRYGFGRTVPRFIVLNLAVAIACSIVAVPIIVWVDHGYTGSGADALTRSMLHVWNDLLLAVSTQDLLTSIADKMISGFVALAVAEMLPDGLVERDRRIRLRSVWLR